MSEEKKSKKTTPRKKAKASTGAWWKSSVVEDTSPEENVKDTKEVVSVAVPSEELKQKKELKPVAKSTKVKQPVESPAVPSEELKQKGELKPVVKPTKVKQPVKSPAVSSDELTQKKELKPVEKSTKVKQPVERKPVEKKFTRGSVAKTNGKPKAAQVATESDSATKNESTPVVTKKTAPRRKPRRQPSKKPSEKTSIKEVKQQATLVEEKVGSVEDVTGEKERRPAMIRLMKNPRQPLLENKEQAAVKPAPVRASFTAGIPFGLFGVEQEQAEVSAVEKHVAVKKEVPQPKSPVKKKELVPAVTVAKEPEEKETADPKGVRKLLINAEEPEECRIALLENGRLESLHVSTVNRTQTKNNIYKAKIVAVEPNLQAAFVDYGTDKNGFLPFSEIHPEYYRQDIRPEIQTLVDANQWKRLTITDVVAKGQEVLVQVVKEEIGKKGANMTTYLSLPGRCVVLMPGSDSSGISRKISGETKRSALREIMKGMGIPEGIGWIVRTASVDITEAALTRDVGYLLRLWEETKKKGQMLEGVGMVYEDHHCVLRFLREHFDPDIAEILVDDIHALEQVKEFVELLPAKQRDVRVRLHKGSRPIFNQFSVEDQIESIYQPHVNLPSGGSIVIDPTEALVAIDVNSGSTSKSKNFEASIFLANMEAAVELARQLRLRDLGGLIVVDFIDMRSSKNIREVERQVKVAMKPDKAKVDFSRISKFGLMQISRQKLGAPLEAGNHRVCEYCKGRGVIRSVETLALFYLRRIQTGASRKNVGQVECHFPIDVAQYLLNNKRHELHELEKSYLTDIIITARPRFKPAQNEIIFHKIEKEEVVAPK